MKTKTILLTLSLLVAACALPAGAEDFAMLFLTARDLRTTQGVPAATAPRAELSAMDQVEAASYFADRETAPEAVEKGLPGEPAPVNLGGDGVVKFQHQWTHEALEIRYRDANGRYIPEALARIKHLFRCRLTGREMDVPAKLAELLDIIQEKAGNRTLTIICGYRSPEFNNALAGNSDGVAKKSLHMKGWAADIRVEDVRTSALRDIAKSVKAGGVGYYPADGFVHVDVGAVRYW
jgi:uncharacterized protein YcbK (DUF882 family)